MKKVILILVLMITHFYLHAQKKIQFNSQNYIGLLTGSISTDLEVQTINGLAKGKWFGGIGAGINWYYERTIPVFLLAERGFQIKGNKNIYLSAGSGLNVPWVVRGDKPVYLYRKISAGFYWETGVGYKINVGKKSGALLLHAGVSNKSFKEELRYTSPCPFGPPCTVSSEFYNYKLHAFSVKIGYGF